ncbi:MAG: PEP-utilizing enzyme [Acidimicrobiales bacterium]
MATATGKPTTDQPGPAWPKPGPGTWLLDSSHCGPTPSLIQRDIFSESFSTGFAEGCALFGAPLKTMDLKWVNGRFYRRLVPLVGGGVDLPQPPDVVLRLVSRFHPTFRKAERRAKVSLEQKRWRDEIAMWESTWKPELIATNLRFTDVDLATLSDEEAGDHLRELYSHVIASARLHFRLHVSDMGPLGNLMVHLEDWGLHRDNTFRALVKASPATRAPGQKLRAVAAALRNAGVDPLSLSSLDEARGASAEVSTLLDEFLRENGWRLTTGYEVEDRCLIELPEVLLTAIRGAAGESAVDEDDDSAAVEALAGLRSDVPAEHRAVFDDLVEDARISYGLRDENGPLTYEWPAGLLRRAVLEAGRRLAGGGRLKAAGDVFELTVEEIARALQGDESITTAEIARRAEERQSWASLDAPLRIGPEEPPPPIHLLPPNLAAFTRIVLAVTETLEADASTELLTGMGIGKESFVGVARVVHDAAEALALVEPGDVIVTPYTAPTYNAVLGMAGALVTQEGGLLCHAAVIARELGLPAVIGATDAMTAIPDGATVEVDPVAGRVSIVSPAVPA